MVDTHERKYSNLKKDATALEAKRVQTNEDSPGEITDESDDFV
jgi:hypothetical protein